MYPLIQRTEKGIISLTWRWSQPSHPHQCNELGTIFSVLCLFLEKPTWTLALLNAVIPMHTEAEIPLI